MIKNSRRGFIGVVFGGLAGILGLKVPGAVCGEPHDTTSGIDLTPPPEEQGDCFDLIPISRFVSVTISSWNGKDARTFQCYVSR